MRSPSSLARSTNQICQYLCPDCVMSGRGEGGVGGRGGWYFIVVRDRAIRDKKKNKKRLIIIMNMYMRLFSYECKVLTLKMNYFKTNNIL